MSKTRISLDVQPDVKGCWEDIKQRSGAATLIETLRRAMSLYKLVIEQHTTGGKVILENADGTRETLRLL